MQGMVNVALSLLICLYVCACSNKTSQDIRFAIAQAPINFDPRFASDAASERINRLIYCAPVDFDSQFHPTPWLTRWRAISDSDYELTLTHQCPRFHDGETLTIDDFIETYRSMAQDPRSPHHEEFSNILSFEKQNNNTVRVKLRHPDRFFPSKLVVGVLPKKKLYSQHAFATQPIGSAGFRWVSGKEHLRIERLRDKQQFVFDVVKDPTVRALKLIQGETDLVQGDMPPELVKYLSKQANVKLLAQSGTNFSYLGLNLQDALLQNSRVREALALGINTTSIIEHVLVQQSRQANVILPPEHWAGNASLQSIQYNPLRAKQLLQEAGLTLPVSLEYKTSTDPQRLRLATILQAQLAEAGFAITIKSLDWGTYFQDIKQGNFQLYGLTWVGIKTPEIYKQAFHHQAIPPQGFNRGKVNDPILDEMLEREDWQSASGRIYQELYYIPLWYEGQFAATTKRLNGYALQSDGNWDGLHKVSLARD